jgi:hypothetical protein
MILSPVAISRSSDHRYTYAGKTYPGVTSILKVLGVSWGVAGGWGAKMAAEAAVMLLPELPKMLETSGAEGVKRFLADRKNWKNDEAKQLGSDVHAYADRIANGEPDLIVPAPTRKHVHNYLEWWTASGWKLRASEAFILHPTHGYGGTLDLLCYDRDGLTVLGDIKTGKVADARTGEIFTEPHLQLTAYGAAELIQTAATPEKSAAIYPMPKVDRYVLINVTADGVREIEVPVGTLERLAWGACIDLFTWKETTKGKRL